MVTDELRGNERINGDRGSGRHGREHGVVGSRRVDGKADRLSKRERANQARRVSGWEGANGASGKRCDMDARSARAKPENWEG